MKMASPTTIESLPRDVLSDIFIRLLAKQVAQMRCICKSWNALLSESFFIKSHLHRSIHRNEEILLIFGSDFSLECRSTRPFHSPDFELPPSIKLPVNPQSIGGFLHGKVIGSVNGLICFYYRISSLLSRDCVVYIWNPSLSAVLTLPPCSLPKDDSVDFHFRFGFDPKTDDYKVVKLTSFLRPSRMLPEVEIYSMRKGSWELVTQSFPSHITKLRHEDIVSVGGHEGYLHWLGYPDLESKTQTIVAFDLDAETFHELPLPDSILHLDEVCLYVLGVMSGKLCVLSIRVATLECEVWTMDEYGVAESWVKHPVALRLVGDILPYGCIFALYDPVEAKPIYSCMFMHRLHTIAKVVEYVDSLVWVAPVER